jgi:hypothetical protein
LLFMSVHSTVCGWYDCYANFLEGLVIPTSRRKSGVLAANVPCGRGNRLPIPPPLPEVGKAAAGKAGTLGTASISAMMCLPIPLGEPTSKITGSEP